MHLLIISTRTKWRFGSWILGFNQVTHKFHLRCPLFHRKQWTNCSHHSPNSRPVVGNVWFHGLITLHIAQYTPCRKQTYPTNGQVSTSSYQLFLRYVRFWEGHQNYTTMERIDGDRHFIIAPKTNRHLLGVALRRHLFSLRCTKIYHTKFTIYV